MEKEGEREKERVMGGGSWLREAIGREGEREGGVQKRCCIVSEFILELLCSGCPLNSAMCYAVRSIRML